MRALAGLLLLLCADRAAAQFFDTGAVAGAENSNNTASFKPKFPLNCRPIDFETWELFITLGSAEWCAERYQDEEKNPDGFSAESLKVCTESFSTYLAGVGDPEEPGVNRMFCNVAKMTVDTEMVKMNHYLEAALLSRSHPLVIDHDVKMEFDDWYDRTNLQLLDLFKRGDISGGGPDGEETPQVTEDCANAIGDLMCTYMLPNCTYMPIPRWPYHVLPNWPDIWQEEKDPPINYEKIFPCKEVCELVLTHCDPLWLPHQVHCDNYISKTIDSKIDPTWTLSAYDRREKGGHACADVKMTERFGSGVGSLCPQTTLVAVLLLLLFKLN